MSGIHHSVIAVGDLGASLRFYRDGHGCIICYQSPRRSHAQSIGGTWAN
jgi:catechol 2,3-dioxygenase-like lactoylglutathione lyase family enzyme